MTKLSLNGDESDCSASASTKSVEHLSVRITYMLSETRG